LGPGLFGLECGYAFSDSLSLLLQVISILLELGDLFLCGQKAAPGVTGAAAAAVAGTVVHLGVRAAAVSAVMASGSTAH
jgi:hypothetical protein